MTNARVIVGDCRKVLRTLPEASVHCCVTSPPYWGLRDYGVDGQLGLEPTPEEYIATMVDVFREVRRVLRNDGTLWCNLGDTYHANTGSGFDTNDNGGGRKCLTSLGKRQIKHPTKPKDLLGMPWRLALALQADGWWLRSDIIWHKPNPMPESCTDRPTKAHEYIFLLTKAPSYFYDADAIREKTGSELPPEEYAKLLEETPESWYQRKENPFGDGAKSGKKQGGISPPSGRNRRSVWTIPTQPFSKAHFATFPEKLVEPCIMAGTSDRGCCPQCGAPWQRIVKKERMPTRPARDNVSDSTGKANRDEQRHVTDVQTTGWKPTCECKMLGRTTPKRMMEVPLCPVPCAVLDPFCGSGTTGVVAKKLGRHFIGIELSEKYAEMAKRRIANPNPEPAVPDVSKQMALFDDG